jgi:DHA1 family multidrug resistance protein-like MFS transporter
MERWRVNLYTIWISQVLSLMSFGFGMPFLPFYIQEMGIVDPDKLKIYTGILNAAPAITMGLMAPIWGILADKYGKKLMLLRAMFCATFILAGMGLVANAEQLIALRLFQGLFTGTVTAANVMIAAGTPRQHLSYALGFLSSSQFIGSSFGPVLGGFFAEYVGYRSSFYLGAAVMLLDFFLVLFLAKEENIIQEGMDAENIKEKTGTAAVFTVTMLAMLFILFFTRIARTVFNPYIPLFVQEIQAGIKGAASTTGIINGITGLMTALAGATLSRLGDKHDKKSVMLVLMASGI